MKKFFTVLAFTMTVAANVSAASLVGQCVGPKTKVANVNAGLKMYQMAR